MQKKGERLSLLAYEFWNTIGDIEIKLLQGKEKNAISNFIFDNHAELIKIILLNIGKINKEDDLEEWNLSKASSYLLKIISQLTGVEVIDEMMVLIKGRYIFNV